METPSVSPPISPVLNVDVGNGLEEKSPGRAPNLGLQRRQMSLGCSTERATMTIFQNAPAPQKGNFGLVAVRTTLIRVSRVRLQVLVLVHLALGSKNVAQVTRFQTQRGLLVIRSEKLSQFFY